jgi:hypothetical protein
MQCTLPLWEREEMQLLLWFHSRIALIQLRATRNAVNKYSPDNPLRCYLWSTMKEYYI